LSHPTDDDSEILASDSDMTANDEATTDEATTDEATTEEASTDEPTTTESRFDALPDHESAVRTVIAAAREFGTSCGAEVIVLTAGDDVAPLKAGAGFRYADQYQPFVDALRQGEEVTVVTMTRNGNVIAYGFGELPTKDGVEIMTIDVEAASRRSADVKTSIQINDETFEIGIGHVLALALIDSIQASVVLVNATTAQARYIFKALGFVSRSESNACLLRLEKS
jgi:hypothetical protein